MLAADAAVAAAVFGLEHLISYCNHTKRCFGPTSGGQGRRLCHAMPNHRPGEVNPKQQLPFCCRSPCESRDCCAAADARPNQLQQKSPTGSLPSAVPLAITPTFRPCTHTSDDSYIYQLSFVVATATVSFLSQTLLNFNSRIRRKEIDCCCTTPRGTASTAAVYPGI